MKYRKVINLLDIETTQPSKFRTRNWVEINNNRLRTHIPKSLKFKTTLLKSSLCHYSDTYIFVKVTKKVIAERANATAVIFKYCAPFTNCICKTNNT